MDNKFLEFLLVLGAFPAMLLLAFLEKVYFEKISGSIMTVVSLCFGTLILSGIVLGIGLLIM